MALQNSSRSDLAKRADSAATIGVCAKQSEIPAQLDSLTNNIGYLESAVADLENRLSMYAIPVEPGAECEPATSCETGMGDMIRLMSLRVANATYRLQSLQRRLEV